MGLGTFLVRTLAERLGGSLHFSSSPETGTTATLVLPVHAGAKELARSLS
jgi:signal transduction histidine kinase